MNGMTPTQLTHRGREGEGKDLVEVRHVCWDGMGWDGNTTVGRRQRERERDMRESGNGDR